MNLFFRSKERRNISFGAFLRTDIHSHFLPGLDDGPKDVEGSLLLIDCLIKSGYRNLIATPHVMNDRYLNNPETIRNSLSKLRKALKDRGYTIPIEAAAEYTLDENFEYLLQKGDILTFGDNFILLDAFSQSYRSDFEDLLFDIQIKNYQVVLAQVERCQLIDERLSFLASLKEKGVYFQVNALSFTGYYGKRVKRVAEKMLESGLIDFIGTNAHHPKHLKILEKYQFSSKVIHEFENSSFLNLSIPVVQFENTEQE